ncbi:MAG: beta-ketoacyl synthase N-terminal-like domain-containing protein, partial [Rubrivivax sp.]
HGARRVGLVLGTSASTIAASEAAYRHPADDGGFPPALRHPPLHSPHAVTAFCAVLLGIAGPALTVSTACSSSARAFGHAERWLRLGLADAVVVGGVDALCDSVLYGFHALGLVAPGACRPFDAARCGISVGEAAGFALLERQSAPADASATDSADPADPTDPLLLGYGEANDAHHMSSPHPQGLGAERALDDALARAGIDATRIGYLNLHGTATPQNDAVEAALVARRYAGTVHASATKGLTGHTMGAAGIVEALLCLLALQDGLRSGSAGLSAVDPAFGDRFAAQLRLQPTQTDTAVAASHSFGFGGNNAVLIFGRGVA